MIVNLHYNDERGYMMNYEEKIKNAEEQIEKHKKQMQMIKKKKAELKRKKMKAEAEQKAKIHQKALDNLYFVMSGFLKNKQLTDELIANMSAEELQRYIFNNQ